ncbi:hypothetical protein R0381_002067 [Jeongeupia wiesaeckerbachi]|uniref:hypothetical protein n=1 Tax=Jeongeupia wiesaeckerbachi TaxID=3051218 RepID=UPI003D805E15
MSYYYVGSLGLKGDDEAPADHVVDRRKLEQALVNAYNNRNGASAATLPEILE